MASWAMGNQTRFVYASSAAIYEYEKKEMCDKNNNINCLRPPLNMY